MVTGKDHRAFLPLYGIFSLLIMSCFLARISMAYPVEFTDSRGSSIVINERPNRVVSVVPSITEIIFKLGAGDALKGITYHTTYPAQAHQKRIVGGFFSPSVEAIRKIRPDLLFVAGFHKKLIKAFVNTKCKVINLETNSLAESYKNILLLGRIFHREKKARQILKQIRDDLTLIQKKVSRIPVSERKRVIRLMGRNSVMTPGDDSFQNEMIRAAGGIPPRLGKTGQVVPITKEEWMRFNPQVIYACGGDRGIVKKIKALPGWRDVDALKHGKVFFFPCDLTFRAATNTSCFIKWLFATIYQDYLALEKNQLTKGGVFASKQIPVSLPYIKEARISYSRILDFVNKSLIIEFAMPLSVVSTLEGQRHGIEVVGNHYLPPPCWGISHKWGPKRIRERVYDTLGLNTKTSSFLFTGADMDNLAIAHEKFRDMEVYALVTAGVRSNALRMSADPGRYYEPGTINIIILSNMELTPRAMTRAIISATEAKTAALMDLDIRSSESPRFHQATGTGTDNIIVVQGAGVRIDNAGGHSKMGELIAKAVHAGVKEAISKQNGIINPRSVFHRLKERRISIFQLVSMLPYTKQLDRSALVEAVEEVLLDPYYSSFIQAALSLSDGHARGLILDLASFEAWCKSTAEQIAGRKIRQMLDLVSFDKIPSVLEMALNAILNGVCERLGGISP